MYSNGSFDWCTWSAAAFAAVDAGAAISAHRPEWFSARQQGLADALLDELLVLSGLRCAGVPEAFFQRVHRRQRVAALRAVVALLEAGVEVRWRPNRCGRRAVELDFLPFPVPAERLATAPASGRPPH